METLRTILWRQYGAAIDTLGNAIVACPDRLWDDGSRPPELFWYSAYHCLFYLDYYLSDSPEGFAPPAPFGLTELDGSGPLPERTYTKDELRAYLAHGRRKCRARMESLSEEDLVKPCGFGRRHLTVVELQVYCLRHVQHHAAQLNLLLRQKAGLPSPWLSVAQEP